MPIADLSGKAVASGHFENKQDTVIIYLFPLLVLGSGPIKSTPIVCQTLLWTGIGCNSALAFSNFLYQPDGIPKSI